MRLKIHCSLLLTLFFAVSTHAAPTDLFIPVPDSISQFEGFGPTLKKEAPNNISAKEKQVGINSPELAAIPESLNINLFGTIVIATLDRVEKVSKDSYSWIGHIEDNGNTNNIEQVILVVSGSLVQGNITYQNQQYHIRYVGKINEDTIHVLRLVDPSKLKDEHPPGFLEGTLGNTPKTSTKSASDQLDSTISHKSVISTDAAADSGAFVDVMVLWTPAARQAAGGVAAINALVDLAVTETNQSYQNSGIIPRIRLAHKQEVNYTESSTLFTDKDRLQATNDGYMDNIHILRDTHKADLVSLFISTRGPFCGLADLPLIVHDRAAFSVVDYTCAVDNRSFAHELGHNFTARHDWRSDSDTTLPYLYPYSHGHIHDGSDSWRTIMSSKKCTGTGPCTRINYWSNPDKDFKGIPMGEPEGASQATDNRKTLNNTAPLVANYRLSGGDTGAKFSTWDIDGDGQAKPLTDGLLALRYLFGFTDNALISNAVGSGATRNSATSIQAYLQAGVEEGALDIDGNSEVKPLTDGLLVLRYLFGFRGDSLIINAIGGNATRSTATAVETYLQSKMP